MYMPKKLAEDLLDNLIKLAVVANGRPPKDEMEKEAAERWANETFLRLTGEFEQVMEDTWEVIE